MHYLTHPNSVYLTHTHAHTHTHARTHELNQSTERLKEEAHFKDLSVHIASSLFTHLHGDFI